jgi:two-component system, OmpR family, response regulator MprA
MLFFILFLICIFPGTVFMLDTSRFSAGATAVDKWQHGRATEHMATRVMEPRRILVVDDEPLVCDSIKRMLDFDGHQVEVANSGQEALELFEKRKFDLIMIDYRMPTMRGDKLAALIKARAPQQPILMISATAQVLQQSEEPITGVDLMISKPFPLEELREAIAQVLANSTRAA